MESELYFVAFYKHGLPQHLEAGPFFSDEDARCSSSYTRLGGRACVVKTTLTFERVEEY